MNMNNPADFPPWKHRFSAKIEESELCKLQRTPLQQKRTSNNRNSDMQIFPFRPIGPFLAPKLIIWIKSFIDFSFFKVLF